MNWMKQKQNELDEEHELLERLGTKYCIRCGKRPADDLRNYLPLALQPTICRECYEKERDDHD